MDRLHNLLSWDVCRNEGEWLLSHAWIRDFGTVINSFVFADQINSYSLFIFVKETLDSYTLGMCFPASLTYSVHRGFVFSSACVVTVYV